MKEKCAKDYYLQTLPPEALPHRPLETERSYLQKGHLVSLSLPCTAEPSCFYQKENLGLRIPLLCLRPDILYSSSNCNSISGGSCLIFCHTVVVSCSFFICCCCFLLGFSFFVFLFDFRERDMVVWFGVIFFFLKWYILVTKAGPVFHTFASFSEVVISILSKIYQ